MAINKFPEQAELIERVKAILNLSDEALALEVSVRPETMQKYAAGYQKAGNKLMQIIACLPETRHRSLAGEAGGYPSTQGSTDPRNQSSANRLVSTHDPASLPRDVKLDPPSTQEQLARVLIEGTMDEVRMVRQVIETICRQIDQRRSIALQNNRRSALFLDGPHRLVPALGYIPAGLPQDALQQANRFIALPAGKFPEADFALKVHGDSMVDVDIHHGDWVMMNSRREPRNGSVVAALCDGETCLKTYVSDSRGAPFLRSENQVYPPRIIPRDEMQIQGVMIGKLLLSEHEGEIER